MWCQVSHHPSLRYWVYCYVMSSLTPPFIECILMWCQVSHHPSLSVLLCDVKSHTTLHWVYCYVMSSLTPPFIECIVTWCQVSHHPSLSVFLCDVKSHTTLRWVMLSVLLCDVQSHTTLHQVKVIRNSEDCFPTSFDNPKATSAPSRAGTKYYWHKKKYRPFWALLRSSWGQLGVLGHLTNFWTFRSFAKHPPWANRANSLKAEKPAQLADLPRSRSIWMPMDDLPWPTHLPRDNLPVATDGFSMVFPLSSHERWPCGHVSACCHAWVRSWIAWRS